MAIIIPLAIIITIFTGRKEREINRAEWEKLTAGKTKQEKNAYAIGDLLVFMGIAGIIFGVISREQGGMSPVFVVLGAIFSVIGGGMVKKRMAQIKEKNAVLGKTNVE